MKHPSRQPSRPPGGFPSFGGAACVGLLLAGMVSCDRPQQAADARPVAARVGTEVILVSEVEQEIAWRVQRGAHVPSKEALLNDMVERKLLVQKALAAGLEKNQDVQRSWENLLIGRYKEVHLGSDSRDAAVTSEEITERYEANPARFQRGGKARLAILMTALPPSLEPDEVEAKLAGMREARELALQLSEGPGFGPLSARYSEDDVTRQRGGDAGWLDEGVPYRWPEEIVRAGFVLPKGGVSEPLRTAEAVYLVKKLDERPPAKVEIDSVRDRLRSEIHAEKLRAAKAAFARQVREGTPITTFPETLAGLQIPAPSETKVAAEEPPPSIP